MATRIFRRGVDRVRTDRVRVLCGRGESARAESFDRFLRGTVESWRVLRPGVDVALSLDGTTPAPRIVAERTLGHTLITLLNNAAKYTPPRGEITLVLEPREEIALFRVSDNGMGIPAPMLGRVFDLFTQVDNSSTRTGGGLGVGLTLVKEVVELHGGIVDVTSAGAGQGSEFQLSIPLATVTRQDAPVVKQETGAANA